MLIGDAGTKRNDDVLSDLKKLLEGETSPAAVIFLGDNIYPNGMPPADAKEKKRIEAAKKLDSQIEVIADQNHATAIFVPGNHDWKGSLEAQAEHIAKSKRAEGRATLSPPAKNCGPEVKKLNGGVTVIALDTQLLIHRNEGGTYDGAKYNGVHCVDPFAKLAAAIRVAGGKAVVVAHHPIASHGPHGGFHDWKEHLFPGTRFAKWAWIPLPIVGTLFTLEDRSDDLGSEGYQNMIADLNAVFKQHPPLLYAAGHEHSLQIFMPIDGRPLSVVSGSGSRDKVTAVTSKADDTEFAASSPGYMIVDFFAEGDGLPLLTVRETGKTEARTSCTRELN